MLLDTTGQRDLLADLGTRGRRKLNLGEVGLDAEHTSTSGRRANIYEQRLASLLSLATFIAFLSTVLAPSGRRRTKQLICNFKKKNNDLTRIIFKIASEPSKVAPVEIFGSCPDVPSTCPTSLSARHSVGSIIIPIHPEWQLELILLRDE